jgi:hypothetical protein
MTETELKRRLHADVEEILAPSDLVERARLGGDRRLRRRRFAAITAGSLAVVAIAGTAVGVPAYRNRGGEAPIATPAPTQWVDPYPVRPDDPYAVLMKQDTGGDLANDSRYLADVLAVWAATRRKEQGRSRDPIGGDTWAALRGEPRIYWAGGTPAGRIAIVVQRYEVPHPNPDVKYALTGIYTTVAIVQDDAQGRPEVRGQAFPHNPQAFPVFSVQVPGKPSLVVVVGLGKRLGWGLDANTPPGKIQSLPFRDGVAVLPVPDDQIERVHIEPLPPR